jgi:hypothetical protein
MMRNLACPDSNVYFDSMSELLPWLWKVLWYSHQEQKFDEKIGGSDKYF